MAVIPEIPGIEVTVCVNGAALQEYQEPDNDEDTPVKIVRYVLAEAGKNFSVSLAFAKGLKLGQQDSLAYYVYVDGNFVKGTFVYGTVAKSSQRKDFVTGPYTQDTLGRWELRRMKFGELETDSTAPMKGPDGRDGKLTQLGEILVTFLSGRAGGGLPPSKPSPFRKIGKMNEKALKGRAITCATELDDSAETASTPSVVEFDADEPPVATFIFKYRSRKDLQSEMIIPRSLSPVPLEERDIETLSVEEARKLLRLQRARAPLLKQELIKRERAIQIDDGTDNDEGIEVIPKKRRVLETVDLTDD